MDTIHTHSHLGGNSESPFDWRTQKRTLHSCTLFPINPFPPPQSHNLKTGQDLDDLLFGMASQIAEREDNIVVEDLRGASIEN